jgi:hypothetical protein
MSLASTDVASVSGNRCESRAQLHRASERVARRRSKQQKLHTSMQCERN